MDTFGQPTIEVDGLGGQAVDGSDGLDILLNGDVWSGTGGRDGIYFGGGRNSYCCTDAAPMLRVGSTLFGQAGPAWTPGQDDWTAVELVATSGSTTTDGTAAAGSGTAHLRYTATTGGLSYVVDRVVSYTAPDHFFTDRFTVTIPEGNTEPVTLLQGGDAGPGSAVGGRGMAVTAPERRVFVVQPATQQWIAYREVAGEVPFDGAVARNRAGPYAAVAAGQPLGFAADADGTDFTALLVEWDLGTAPGTRTRMMETAVGFQGAEAQASFERTSAPVGQAVPLRLELVNTTATPASGLGASLTLPAGLVVAPGAADVACGGTVQAAPGASIVSIASAAAGAWSSCVVTVPVVATAPGTHTIDRSSFGSLSGLATGGGTRALTATPAPAPAPDPTPSPNPPSDEGFRPVPPTRQLDTREGTGGPVAAGSEASFALPGGLPADTAAVMVNVTATGSVAPGYVTVYPCGTSRPNASTLNLQPGHDVSNLALVPVPAGALADLRLCAWTYATTHLVVDVVGAFVGPEAPTSARAVGTMEGAVLQPAHASFVPTTPTRLADKRRGARPAPGGVTRVPLTTLPGVPGDAVAVVVTVTADRSAGEGYVLAWPCDQPRPSTSSLNLKAGQQRANVAVVAMTSGRELCLVASQATDLVVDLAGAFSPSAATVLTSIEHRRLLDTRNGTAAGAGSITELDVRDAVPVGTTAVLLNVTSTRALDRGFVTVWPCGTPRPEASNLNLDPAADVANLVAVAPGGQGTVCLYTQAATDLVIDLEGWFAPTP